MPETATQTVYPEDLSRTDIEELQLMKLNSLLEAIHEANPFWARKLKASGFQGAELESRDDLTRLPLTTKQELVDDQNENGPYGTNMTYPLTGYNRFHQTSGTTGKPMRWLDTATSWNWFMECWAQIYRIIGVTPEDRFCFPFSFGPFIGFWAAFEGATRLGNLCIPAGGLSSEARLRLIIEHEATIICCTPTYALRLIEVAEQEELDLASSAVRMLVVAGEPGGSIPAIKDRIEAAWGARVFDHWGMTDIGSLGIESIEDRGSLLILETECIAEILDPQTHEPVSPGEQGELILTNLGRLGMPILRYRTGDLVKAATTPNGCGRSLLRLEGGILGRADDMVTIRGNNVFPSSVEAVLREFDEIVEFRVTVTQKSAMHEMGIELELQPESATQADAVLGKVGKAIKDRLNFHAKLEAVPAGTLPRFELKGRRFHKN